MQWGDKWGNSSSSTHAMCPDLRLDFRIRLITATTPSFLGLRTSPMLWFPYPMVSKLLVFFHPINDGDYVILSLASVREVGESQQPYCTYSQCQGMGRVRGTVFTSLQVWTWELWAYSGAAGDKRARSQSKQFVNVPLFIFYALVNFLCPINFSNQPPLRTHPLHMWSHWHSWRHWRKSWRVWKNLPSI